MENNRFKWEEDLVNPPLSQIVTPTKEWMNQVEFALTEKRKISGYRRFAPFTVSVGAAVLILGIFAANFVPQTNVPSPHQGSLPQTQPIEASNFKLSAKEKEVYSNFQEDLNEQQLKELEPISIAKLYVQARLDNKHDVVYALYTDRNGYVQWTKEEDQKIPDSDRGTKEQILKTFNNIGTGKFIQTNDFRGYIEFLSSEDTKTGFQMIKDEDDIWNVSFQPIQ